MINIKDRIITSDFRQEDIEIETKLRPQTIDTYIGQKKVKETLKVYIEAAKIRNERCGR